MDEWLTRLLVALALPKLGLSTVFVVSFISATLLPMGSEVFVLGLLAINPELFWPTIMVATVGNTLGGAFTWWLGYRAEKTWEFFSKTKHQAKGLLWLKRFGAKACLLSWLPLVGDPLCAVAGWLKLPFWPCLGYMALGKFLRYLCFTFFSLHVASYFHAH